MNGRNEKTPVLVFLGILCLVLAGCSGGGGPTATDATTHESNPSVYTDSSVVKPQQPSTIYINRSGLSPQTLNIEYTSAAGSDSCNPCPQVTWANNDVWVYTIFSTTGDFASPDIVPGGQWSWTFNQPGTYEYESIAWEMTARSSSGGAGVSLETGMEERGTVEVVDGGGTYVGEYKDNLYHGQGTMTLSNGRQYVGEFKEGKRHGEGTLIYPDGRQMEGIWEEGEFLGYSKSK